MRQFKLTEYMDAGCFQVDRGKGFLVGMGLHGYTDGRMCVGCYKFNNGSCPAYKILIQRHVHNNHDDTVYTETVRQEAARLGVSISEVRRRRSDAKVTPSV